LTFARRRAFQRQQWRGKRAESNAAKKFSYWSFYRFGNSQQSLDGNDFFPAFNFPKIFGVQIHYLSQSFLGITGVFPAKANGITNYLAVP
jgi:hypothetical protein